MANANDPKQGKPRGESRLGWVLGWIVLPISIIAALFFGGVHLGARNPDMALSRLLLNIFGAEAGVATQAEATRSKPSSSAKPGEAFAHDAMLTQAQLQVIVDKSLVSTVAELDCEHVCRAYSQAEHQLAVYAIDTCTLTHGPYSTPSRLVCKGKFAAPQAVRSPE